MQRLVFDSLYFESVPKIFFENYSKYDIIYFINIIETDKSKNALRERSLTYEI